MPTPIEVYRHNKVDILAIDNAACRAEISLFGGQVLGWQPINQKPVFWMSSEANYDGKAALRGGIPICWPWFGQVEGKGRHGLVRTNVWQLDELREEEDQTTLILSIEPGKTEAWPHASRLIQTLVFGKELHQTLTMFNDTDTALSFTYAFHNYFNVSDPANIHIPEIIDTQFEDKISNAPIAIDTGDTPYTGPIDRIYHCDKHAHIIDTGLQRSIAIKKTQSDQWVLWNPGELATSQMADIKNGTENNFLCFETAQTTELIVPAKSSVETSQIISTRMLTPQ